MLPDGPTGKNRAAGPSTSCDEVGEFLSISPCSPPCSSLCKLSRGSGSWTSVESGGRLSAEVTSGQICSATMSRSVLQRSGLNCFLPFRRDWVLSSGRASSVSERTDDTGDWALEEAEVDV